MPTKLSRFCEGVIEASWLVTIILVPIFFNVYSSRIFEPDKIAILRSLVLVILAAWIIKLLEESGVQGNIPSNQEIPLKFITKIPLVSLVIALAVMYLISTILSVTPRVSLFGSYQRLQGTYTTLSYLIIFTTILGNLRKREQVERLITTIVLTSLPVALYGVLQRYEIDPIPWGGDTSRRIAANMGNSIFVAAYLIMVFPLTVGRIVQSFGNILSDNGSLWGETARSTIYVFIAALQLIAIYMSGSRGPALGWMAGSFFLFLLLSLYWGKRWLTLGTVGIALLAGIFLLVFNIAGPLENLRQSPAIGRFGLLLDSESNSALVRKYIWQGAAEMVSWHEPLVYPDDRIDRLNILRPIIGYGPESMYVAYNRFYVPELAYVESRSATPDRSHNETWDALVITGLLGMVLYLTIYTFIFYFGLKWLGIIPNKKLGYLFLGLCLGGGFIGASGFSLWRGIEYLGVGFPLGMLMGLLLYITYIALFVPYQPPSADDDNSYALLLIVLVAAIVSHFVEINFGIAIAVTRTYFWVYVGVLVVYGYFLPRYREQNIALDEIEYQYGDSTLEKSLQKPKSRSRQQRLITRNTFTERLYESRKNMIPSVLIAAVLFVLGYNFLSNSYQYSSPIEIIWNSLTQLPNKGAVTSNGILMMLVTSWIGMSIVWTSEGGEVGSKLNWWKSFILTLLASMIIGSIYWIWHAAKLANIAKMTANNVPQILEQIGRYESLISNFYLYAFLLILGLAIFLPPSWPINVKRFTVIGGVSMIVVSVVIFLSILYTNLRVIQADVAFKLAEPFTRNGQWPVAISIYNRAIDLAPNEDYYYLFLGRAYLEHGKSLTDKSEREMFTQQAEEDLFRAQQINSLNTDHTANLARLYSLWAAFSEDLEVRKEKAEKSADYFAKAVNLSPNNARLWDEWALLYMNILNQPEDAHQRLVKSLEIDPKYHWTHALMGDLYQRKAQYSSETSEQQQLLQTAADYFKTALELPVPGEPQASFNYALALGGVYAQTGSIEEAIDTYKYAIQIAPDGAASWQVEQAIARLYFENGERELAISHLMAALTSAPEENRETLQLFIDQLKSIQPQK